MLNLFKKNNTQSFDELYLKKSNDFNSLLKDLFFIHKNIKTLDSFNNGLFVRHLVNGIISTSDSKTALNEIDNINTFLANTVIIYDFFIFSGTVEITVDFHEYESHIIYRNRLVIFFKNGTSEEITF